MVQQPLVGQGLLFIEASLSQSDTPKSVRLLWTSDQLDPYLTTHNNHKGRKSKPPEEFEPTIPASERQQTYAFESATTGIAHMVLFA